MYPEPLAPTTNCPVELFQVKFASASKVFAVPEPVITLLSALLFIVVLVTVSNEGSAPLFALKNLPSVEPVPCGNFAKVTEDMGY